MKTKYQIVTFVALLALTGCNPNDNPPPGDQPPATPGPTGAVLELPKTAPALAESKDAFIASMDQKLKDFDAQLDEMARKSADYKDEAKVQADQAMASLRDQRAKLEAQFNELKRSSADAWTEVKAGFQSALNDLEKAFQNAKAKFS